MGIFDGISEASISSGGLKLRDGHRYTLEILSCILKNGHFGQTFIAETVVHESDDPERPPGCRPSWTCNMKHANAKGNVLVFIGAACGIDPKGNEAELRRQVTSAVAEHVVSQHNPLRGKFVKCSVEEIETKGKNEFLKHYFDPCTQTFPSRANDEPVLVAGQTAPSTPTASLPSMPGGFVLPTTPALPGLFGTPPPIPGTPPALPGTPPPILAAAPPIPTFPPAGWVVHPDSAAHFFKGKVLVTEVELRALVASGRA